MSEFTISNLASLTGLNVATKNDGSRLQGCTIRKLRYQFDFTGKTAGVAEGPLLFGAQRGLTLAQLAAVWAADPQSTEDKVALAQSQEAVLVFGWAAQSATSGASDNAAMGLRSAKWPGWNMIEGVGWSHFVFNLNPGDPVTTGATATIYTESFGDWLND